MSTEISSPRRRYQKRARATKEQQTRLRIIEAAMALHGTVGPAHTTVSAIAERAGVRRATVYRHFPDERALFLGCSGAWGERHPVPDPAAWSAIDDPVERLQGALGALSGWCGGGGAALEAARELLYGWYEEAEPMLDKRLRDMEAVPIVAELQAGRLEYLAAVE